MMNKIFSNNYLKFSIILMFGIFLGWLFFHSGQPKEESHNHVTEAIVPTIWTCAMHPQIRMTEAGKCPICAMELIRLNQAGPFTDSGGIYMTKEAVQLANVQTTIVSLQKPVKELRLYGKVQADERLMQSQVSYFPGRIEKLLINFTGELVRKGQKLALIYSPELITAQQELIETLVTKQSQPALYEAAKEKLRLPCFKWIESAAKSVTGVISAIWSSETKKLDVQFDIQKTNSDDIQKAVAKVGHDTEKFKAQDDLYKHLPGCCLYRKSN